MIKEITCAGCKTKLIKIAKDGYICPNCGFKHAGALAASKLTQPMAKSMLKPEREPFVHPDLRLKTGLLRD